jgi:hypothetical protein
MLNAFYQRTEGMRRDKYNTKLDGMEVCNACYVMVLRYSQRRFKQLKVAHRVYGRVAAVHGNTCNLRERAKMSAARESFTAFVGDAGCTQPHCQVRRKMDNSVVPLILLPMNTTKVDVFHFVNEEEGESIGGRGIHVSSVIPPAVVNRISTYSNIPVLEVLKVLPLLGIQVWDGSDYECRCEIADKGALLCTYPTSNGGETRLLVVQEVSHDNPRYLHVFDCGPSVWTRTHPWSRK